MLSISSFPLFLCVPSTLACSRKCYQEVCSVVRTWYRFCVYSLHQNQAHQNSNFFEKQRKHVYSHPCLSCSVRGVCVWRKLISDYSQMVNRLHKRMYTVCVCEWVKKSIDILSSIFRCLLPHSFGVWVSRHVCKWFAKLLTMEENVCNRKMNGNGVGSEADGPNGNPQFISMGLKMSVFSFKIRTVVAYLHMLYMHKRWADTKKCENGATTAHVRYNADKTNHIWKGAFAHKVERKIMIFSVKWKMSIDTFAQTMDWIGYVSLLWRNV